MKARDLIGGNVRLTTLPDVYLNVKAVLDDPDAGVADMVRAIEHDPGITARLLRIANSAFFGFAAKVATVSHAVSLLGTQQIHDLVLATSLANVFKSAPGEGLDMGAFWHGSMYRAVTSKLLAGHCNVLDGERLFVAGLLSDIGHLVMHQTIAEAARAARRESLQSARPLHVVERERIGFDSAEVGGELLQLWNLPSSLVTIVRHHCEPVPAGDFALETAIVHIAAYTAHTVSGAAPAMALNPSALRIAAASEDLIAGLAQQAGAQVEEAVTLIFNERRDCA